MVCPIAVQFGVGYAAARSVRPQAPLDDYSWYRHIKHAYAGKFCLFFFHLIQPCLPLRQNR